MTFSLLTRILNSSPILTLHNSYLHNSPGGHREWLGPAAPDRNPGRPSLQRGHWAGAEPLWGATRCGGSIGFRLIPLLLLKVKLYRMGQLCILFCTHGGRITVSLLTLDIILKLLDMEFESQQFEPLSNVC